MYSQYVGISRNGVMFNPPGVVQYLALPLLLSTEAIITLWFAECKKKNQRNARRDSRVSKNILGHFLGSLAKNFYICNEKVTERTEGQESCEHISRRNINTITPFRRQQK